MTRKDYQLIADVFNGIITSYAKDSVLRREHEKAAVKMADSLASTNARFDRARFLAACGMED